VSLEMRSNIIGMESAIKAMQGMKPGRLKKLLKETQVEAVTPLHTKVLLQIHNLVGKHDTESLQRALQHRWFRNGRGKPVKYSRMYMIRQLLRQPIEGKSAFGLRWGIFPQKNGSFSRVKIWNPGLHLIDRGRGKTRPYVGWNRLGKMFASETQTIVPKFIAKLRVGLQIHIYRLIIEQNKTLRKLP